MFGASYNQNSLCGCWFPYKPANSYHPTRKYLPQVNLSSHTNILAATSRTTLKQTFVNSEDKKLEQVQYTFPLYDGVSVVGFTCTVGSKTIVGVVKERQQAKVEYQEAVARGETAGLLEQLPEASDVFTTSIGNVPPKEQVLVEIVYLGELKHDAETDGSRFTIPTVIAPRYGSFSSESAGALSSTRLNNGGISISVDVALDEGSIVRGLQSPSHPIAVTMGRTSIMDEESFSNNHASAALTLGTTELEKDFVVVVLAKGTETPRAILETHPTIPNQRALTATLVPKFNIPNISPEIVFVVDRSGSMGGKIDLVVTAMKVFLKSLPVGVKFNICSFGSSYSFLFPRSKTYDQSSLQDALKHLQTFEANFGGTEMLRPVKATIENRYKDLPLEVMLLTDGEIWNQDELFNFINETSNARFFTLGIGSGASSALVEGIARAGNGFAQWVHDNEKMDKRVVRMLKGALTPHISDYTLEVTYAEDVPATGEEDFEMVDSVTKDTPKSLVTDLHKTGAKKPISLFDANATEEPTNPPVGRYDNLPDVPIPKVLQAPHKVPSLFPFNRTTVYLLLGPDAPRKTPKTVTLRGTSDHGPLELQIAVEDVGTGETIHQLAAKKAVHELEQGRGWITEARDSKGQLLKSAHPGKWDLLIEREAVRLGVLFQVGGKWCSFVAVEKKSQSDETSTPPAYSEKQAQAYESVPQARSAPKKASFLSRSRNAYAPPPPGMAMAAARPMGLAAPPPPPAPQASRAAGYGLASPMPALAQPLPTTTFGAAGGAAVNSISMSADSRSMTKKKARAPLGFGGSGIFGSLGRRASKGVDDDGSNEDEVAEGGANGKAAVEDLSSLPATEKMHRLIDLQLFDGSWTPSAKLFDLLGITDERFKSMTTLGGGAGAGAGADENVKATALAIAWFQTKVPAEEEVWEMVVEKALGWLASKAGGEDRAKNLVDAACKML